MEISEFLNKNKIKAKKTNKIFIVKLVYSETGFFASIFMARLMFSILKKKIIKEIFKKVEQNFFNETGLSRN